MFSSFVSSLCSRLPEQLRSVVRRPASPSYPVDEDSFRGLDAEINERSTPPPEEHFDLRCIWGVEFYTPSYIDTLESSLVHLGWGTPVGLHTERDPILWLRGLRRHRYSSSWFSLGPLATEDGPSFLGGTRKVPELPPYVPYAQGHIAALSPSLVAVSLCFALDESLSTKINASLREDRTSFLEARADGYAIRDPRSQKLSNFEETRRELQGSIHEWFGRHLPGVFVSGNVDVPTCELITARVARPYIRGKGEAPKVDSYIRIVGFEESMDSWHTDKMRGLLFDIPRASSHPLFMSKDSDLEAVIRDGYGSPRPGSIAFMDQAVSSMLRAWAVLPLMEHLTREVATMSVPANDAPEQALDVLKRGMLSRIDIAALSSELADESRANRWIHQDASQFVRARPIHEDRDDTLGKVLDYRIKSQAAWLKETDRSARANSEQYGTLLAAAENIRLQKSLKRLTWALTVLALLAIAMPVVAAKCF